MKTKTKTVLAAAVAAVAFGAFADFDINLDLSGKPIRDLSKSTSKAICGYISAVNGPNDSYWYVTNQYETARVFKEAGCFNHGAWRVDQWFAQRNNPNPKKRTNPKAFFDFVRQNGFKFLVSFSGCGTNVLTNDVALKQNVDSKLEFVKWVVDNGYKDCVQGFELGCETYYVPYKNQDALVKLWSQVIPGILKLWPKACIGVPVAENFELNPDIKQVRNRMLAAGEIKRDTYFAAAAFNKYSAYFIMELKKAGMLDKITHITYHTYGAEIPYSCSYYGVKRIRGFEEAFPEIKGKRTWWTEIRPRSDEDNRCQRIFREALVMGHYTLMMACQTDVDGFFHHNMANLAGALYISYGRGWHVQWRDEGGDYPDTLAPMNRPRMEVGAQGAVYRIIGDAFRQYPQLWHHGTSKEMNTEDSFYTSARVMSDVYKYRVARKERRQEGGLLGGDVTVPGEVEWVALTSRNTLCLVMVNTKQTAEKVRVTVPGKIFCAPTYRLVRIKDPKYIDCREVPGEAKLWETFAYEDTQTGPANGGPEVYEKMQAKCDDLIVEIGPNTVQSVEVVMKDAPKSSGK